MKTKNDKIIVAMSGGVDSSVAALLAKKKYQDVLGVFMHFWKDESHGEKSVAGETIENKCCSTKALMDARTICQKLAVPLYTLNMYDEFKNKIVDDFLLEYGKGKTPNPCIRCNKFIKLGGLIKKAKSLGYSKVASGHYAILRKSNGIFRLFRSVDSKKDQSYFLYRLTQKELKHLDFPLGTYKKPQVREIAKKSGLPVYNKSESQEICFIPGKSHNDFLKRYLDLVEGDIVDKNGTKIGSHNGLPLYTLGQRKGIEIGGSGPYYVVGKDFRTNNLIVSTNRDDEFLYTKKFTIKDSTWISHEPEDKKKYTVQIRYGHSAVQCSLLRLSSSKFDVILKNPQRAVAPGQSAVVYLGDEVIGGGVIYK